MRRNKQGDPVAQAAHMVDMTTRQWGDDEIRRAQLRIAEIALTKKNPRSWLRETLDMLGLLPTDKNRVGRYRTNATSQARMKGLVQTTDTVTTDLERNTGRVVDTQGHGTIEGYEMHIKRYERPCVDCLEIKKFYDEFDAAERGITIHDNHTVGYQ